LEQIFGVETKVRKFKWYTKKIFSLHLYSPEICQHSKPGHFVMVRDKNWRLNPFLNRPMSIANVDKDSNIFELQILVTGKGTTLLSQIHQDESIYVIGPLGNNFSFPKEKEHIALISGGIGVAPLIYYESILKEKNVHIDFFYGAAKESEFIPENYLPKNVHFSTDDGSRGFKGFVTQDFNKYIAENKIQKIYACGPNPMLKAVQDIAINNDIYCEISIETVMACGFGICQGCIVRKKENENEFYLTCVEGPVFNAKNITLD
jgi:dihydroorotate dehydrogenase electron transfer subunit